MADLENKKANNPEKTVKKKSDKPSLWSKIASFARSIKSEVKKIVWPGIKEVVKNTIIVLIMCAVVGAFIWLVDFGLGSLLQELLKL